MTNYPEIPEGCPDPQTIADGLTEAQRRHVMTFDDEVDYHSAGLESKGLFSYECIGVGMRRARLTPLGVAVRECLKKGGA
jgi:hypothetical protein